MGPLSLEAVAHWTGVGDAGSVLRSKTELEMETGPCGVGNR